MQGGRLVIARRPQADVGALSAKREEVPFGVQSRAGSCDFADCFPTMSAGYLIKCIYL